MTAPTRRRTPRPTVEQLLILVDRAERGRLSGAEGAVLRTAVAAMGAARRAAGGGQAAGQVREQRLQAQIDAAAKLLAGVYGITREQALAEIQAEARHGA